MQVIILREVGFDESIFGMSLSHYKGDVTVFEWWAGQREKAVKRAGLLAHKQGGHNKFLESMQVWMMIRASRAFWQEFDTYRVGISKQSESTMHTLSKRAPQADDFEENTPAIVIQNFHGLWEEYKESVVALKHCLPESWLQRRMVCTNYKVLQHIIKQRRWHRYYLWDVFIDDLLRQVEHPEFLEQTA